MLVFPPYFPIKQPINTALIKNIEYPSIPTRTRWRLGVTEVLVIKYFVLFFYAQTSANNSIKNSILGLKPETESMNDLLDLNLIYFETYIFPI